MSIEAVSLVLNHSRAQGRAKLVLIGIANHMGDQGAWPSIETLARYANASERSVKRDIQELVDLGELVVEYQQAPTRTQYKTNLYWIQVSGVTNGASGVTDLTSGVTTQVNRGDTVGTHNHNITINEPSIESLVQDFEKFWFEYPNKRGKQAAEKAFVKALSNVDAATLIAGAKRYAGDPNLPDLKFVKHPATWLNAGCWDDPLLPVDPQRMKQNEKQRIENELNEYLKGLENE
jgi:hypothetical protein